MRIAPYLLLLLAACGGSTGSTSSRKDHYHAFVKKFGDAVIAQDFDTAYAMTSREFQAKTSADAFRKLFLGAAKRFGTPKKVETGTNSVDPKELAAKLYDSNFPGIPGERRQARISLNLGTEIHDNGYVVDGYECWINIVSEDGEDRIVTIEQWWTR